MSVDDQGSCRIGGVAAALWLSFRLSISRSYVRPHGVDQRLRRRGAHARRLHERHRRAYASTATQDNVIVEILAFLADSGFFGVGFDAM
jgi:hypothetical protein